MSYRHADVVQNLMPIKLAIKTDLSVAGLYRLVLAGRLYPTALELHVTLRCMSSMMAYSSCSRTRVGTLSSHFIICEDDDDRHPSKYKL